MWLKRKPTTKGGNTVRVRVRVRVRVKVCRVVPAMPCCFLNVRFCAFSGKEFLFKFLMHSPKRYLNKQIIIVTFRPKHPK